MPILITDLQSVVATPYHLNASGGVVSIPLASTALWSSSNTGVFTVTPHADKTCTITAVAAGTAQLSLQLTVNAVQYNATDTITVVASAGRSAGFTFGKATP